ncbi:prolyl oligopeptidase family serine peptidase [Deinococcus sp. MIMF12]|uniref:Prolyl oligopeptidase family serine peptidase n=1 Tax=Deinococcus rhizophilus TaxID=3049544 RepID=A0ABT7JL32_9DEIO|nr:prolyl oligopeptidase family serine peptidase [Deinococcus rhizophilus]MDL2344359.1 prolyl oligopeptidase family serine peptidase [Deinococcus rhizophilus]
MRRLFQLLLLLALGAGYVALVGPERLPFALPFELPWAGRTAPTGEADAPTPDTAAPGGALEGVTDAALERLVARQPISIQALREREYPGSALTVVQTLPPGVNYSRQVVSYRSDGLTIYALLTVPGGTPPEGGWPAIVFNHGYIPPDVYRTTERYVAYQDAFARAGFVTFKSDYRGHGDSGGEATGGYNDPGYTVDVLNAAASLKRDGRVNRGRIGLWGHSMGGQLSLRAMLVDRELRAASLWAGVVAGYDVLATDWGRGRGRGPGEGRPALDSLNRRYLRALSPNAYLEDLNGRPLQLHHGTADEDVPYSFQQALAGDLRGAGQGFTAYRYEGDDHNLSRNLGTALRRSVAFFQEHL